MKMTPLYNSILVEPIAIDYKTKSGLIIQETGTRAIMTQPGKVLAVGKGMITPDGGFVPLSVKIGDIVLYTRGAGLEMKQTYDGDSVLLLKESEIHCILVPDVDEKLEEVDKVVQFKKPT